MSYNARVLPGGDKLYITEAIQKDSTARYYCLNPDCNCGYSVQAVHSTKRRAHFGKLPSSHHVEGCPVPLLEKLFDTTGRLNGYDLNNVTPEQLLEAAIVRPNKTNANPNNNHRIRENAWSVNGDDPMVNQPIVVNSIRNLYMACKELPLNTPYGNGTLGDIYVGIENSHIFTRYIQGLKLIECRFVNFNAYQRTNYVNLLYPIVGEPQFNIAVIVEDEAEYAYLSGININDDYPILIYTDNWRTNRNNRVVGHIQSRNQMVITKRRRARR